MNEQEARNILLAALAVTGKHMDGVVSDVQEKTGYQIDQLAVLEAKVIHATAEAGKDDSDEAIGNQLRAALNLYDHQEQQLKTIPVPTNQDAQSRSFIDNLFIEKAQKAMYASKERGISIHQYASEEFGQNRLVMQSALENIKLGFELLGLDWEE